VKVTFWPLLDGLSEEASKTIGIASAGTQLPPTDPAR